MHITKIFLHKDGKVYVGCQPRSALFMCVGVPLYERRVKSAHFTDEGRGRKEAGAMSSHTAGEGPSGLLCARPATVGPSPLGVLRQSLGKQPALCRGDKGCPEVRSPDRNSCDVQETLMFWGHSI